MATRTLNVYFQTVPEKVAAKNLTLEPFQKDPEGKIHYNIHPALFNIVRGVYSREVAELINNANMPRKFHMLSADTARKTLKFGSTIVEPLKLLYAVTEIESVNIGCCGFISAFLLKEYLEKEMPEGVEVVYHDFPETFFEPRQNRNQNSFDEVRQPKKGNLKVSKDKLSELSDKFGK